MPTLCEDCRLKQPNCGLPSERRRRWCATCAKAHAGARDLTFRRCEDCGLKQPSYGLIEEGLRRRWCSRCAGAHEGARSRGRGRPDRRRDIVAATGSQAPVAACQDCALRVHEKSCAALLLLRVKTCL